MNRDYSNDDMNMINALNESMYGKTSTGIDQFTPKITPRGNPNQRLSYASYFEEDGSLPEVGSQVTYTETGELVNIVNVNSKTAMAVIELPDETRVYRVPFSQLEDTF